MPGIWRNARRAWQFISRRLPPANFITLHYLYFIVTCLLSSVIFWGSSTPPRSVRYIDSLFLTISAMTGAGLNTINLSTLNTFQQFLLFLLIMMGSAIFVSAFVVQLRRSTFEKKFKAFIASRDRRGRPRSRTHGWNFNSHPRQNDVSRDTIEVPDEEAALGGNRHLDRVPRVSEHIHAPPARPVLYPSISSSGQSEQHEQCSDELSEKPPQTTTIQSSTSVTFDSQTLHRHRSQTLHSPASAHRHRASIFTMQGVGARPSSSLYTGAEGLHFEAITQPTNPLPSSETEHISDGGPLEVGRHLESFGGWISRNSQFHGLTIKEREQLGGYEYQAVSLLAWVVPVYFVLWQLLGCVGCAAWVAYHRPNVALENGLNPWWTGAFNAVSAFNNSGMSLLDANMTAFQNGYYLLLTMGLLILAGNTCYPIFLRLIVWSMHRLALRFQHRSQRIRERVSTLKFLLDHPRRCYTNLFPSRHTWWLLISVVTLNGIDWAAFEILNIGNSYLYTALSPGERVIDGLFQALAVRSGGFYVVTIPSLRISLLVLYVVMMYISVYPVVITMRNSNVYEERSLGIYAEDDHVDANPQHPHSHRSNHLSNSTETPDACHLPLTQNGDSHPKPRKSLVSLFRTLTNARDSRSTTQQHPDLIESNSQFIRAQLRAQLAHDLWWIALALFLIMIIEGTQFAADPATFSVFNFLFEIVSGYGCVGISVGVPGQDYSFAGSWHTLSKLILCAVMLRGRHRGLPVAIDKAVLLPGEESARAEEHDAWLRATRSRTRGHSE